MTHDRLSSRHARRILPATLLLAVAAGSLAACDEGRAGSPGPAPSVPVAPAPTSAPPEPAAGAVLHMVDNGGHRLAFQVTAGRLPAIVLDAGGGEDSSEWKDIVPALHAATGSQIITYDRAGLGGSDEVKGPWSAVGAVSDLAAGLRELGVTKQIVLVAHSQAGEVATGFARANPAQVSGAVLVDANLPEFFTDEEIARLVEATTPAVEAAKADLSTKENRQLVATAESFVEVHHAYHQTAWPAGVPATVIVSEKTPFDGSPEDAQRWRDAAAAFVRSGQGRTLVTAEHSSHEVPKDRPDLVRTEIEKMVAQVG